MALRMRVASSSVKPFSRCFLFFLTLTVTSVATFFVTFNCCFA